MGAPYLEVKAPSTDIPACGFLYKLVSYLFPSLSSAALHCIKQSLLFREQLKHTYD